MKLIPSKKSLYTILTCVLCGLLTGLSFPPFKTWFLVYFGLILIVHLILSSTSFLQVLARGYLSMLILNAFTLYWIGGWHSNDMFLKIGGVSAVLIHPLFFLIPFALTYFSGNSFGRGAALVLFPFFWVGFEYFHNLGQLAFPWLELGNTETYNIFRIQYAEYAGVHGISFLICVISVLLYVLVKNIASRKWVYPSKKAYMVLGIIIILIVFPNIYSYVYLTNNQNILKYFERTDNVIKTAVIQANVDPFKKWLGNRDSLVESYMKSIHDALKTDPDMIVMHETATPYYFLEEYYHRSTERFIDIVDSSRKYLLMGIPHIVYYPDSIEAPKFSKVSSGGRRYDSFNSAILLEPGKTRQEYQIHKKVKLVPVSERIPYKEYFPFLRDLVKWGVGISSWEAGDELRMFEMNNPDLPQRSRFITLICFESVFSEYVSEGVKRGAEFLVVITNDGWWGKTSGPYQHQQFAVLRAIENRKWIVRAAQTGVSCFIDPLGNIFEATSLDSQSVIYREIIPNSEKTFYSVRGDLTGKAAYYLSLVIALVLVVRNIYMRFAKRSS